jgi:hypothetical protein
MATEKGRRSKRRTHPHTLDGKKFVGFNLDAETLAIVQTYPNQSAAVRAALRVIGKCPKGAK